MRVPDIELTATEQDLLAQISFGKSGHDQIRRSIMPMVALSESLLRRGGIPSVRRLYFTDPERNPTGRGKSRQQVFEKNGTSGAEILAHPHFLPYLEYFVFGPKLSEKIIHQFKNASSFSGYLTGGDVNDLSPVARAVVRADRLNPHEAAEEFHKLVLECGGMPSSAAMIRASIRAIRI